MDIALYWTDSYALSINITTRDNTSVANVTGSPDLIENKTIQAAFCIAYSIIFVLGLFGNVLVCYVVIRNRSMQTVTNLFITNLALSDILLCLLAVPFTPLYTFLGRWVFGGPLCRIMPYAQGCSVYISTLTLTSIAVDRFFVIIYPFRPRMKIKTCIGLITLIWCFALFVTFPYGYYMMLHEVDGITYCEETWPLDPIRKAFGAITTSMQFLLPFIIIAFCYTRVSFRLNTRQKFRPGNKNSRKEDAERERKRRTNRMLIAMVAIFGLSWLPLNLINIASDFYQRADIWQYNMLCFFLAHFVAMSSTCYNPFLYAWLNESFRKEFKQILPCLAAFGATTSGRRPYCPSTTERTDLCRSEKMCNGNDTMQENLLSTIVPNVSMGAVLHCMVDECEQKKAGWCGSKGADCEHAIDLYLLSVNDSHHTEKRPIVSAL